MKIWAKDQTEKSFEQEELGTEYKSKSGQAEKFWFTTFLRSHVSVRSSFQTQLEGEECCLEKGFRLYLPYHNAINVRNNIGK